jgi:poly(3-hydroxybutyrate) depolymerase
MPVIVFHGDQDTTVPPTNADQLVSQWVTTDDLVEDGANNGSIAAQPTRVSQRRVPNGRFYTLRSYSDSNGKELIQYWLVHGMGHAWSGGCGCARYADPSGPDATGADYAFFLNHPMPKGTMRALFPVWPLIDDRLTSGILGL